MNGILKFLHGYRFEIPNSSFGTPNEHRNYSIFFIPSQTLIVYGFGYQRIYSLITQAWLILINKTPVFWLDTIQCGIVCKSRYTYNINISNENHRSFSSSHFGMRKQSNGNMMPISSLGSDKKQSLFLLFDNESIQLCTYPQPMLLHISCENHF